MSSGFTPWPFAQNPLFLIPQVINYDLVIQEPYPGVDFVPTIAGGLYAEIRDVNNCLWFVQNAMWNPNSMQWEQDSPANPILPAYALELCADGSLSYNIAPATGAISTPVVWQTVWNLDANGNMTVEPATATSQSQVAEEVNPTWDGGVGASMVAREVNVTDTSSASASYLDQLSVNGTVKWQVDKHGVLTVGTVPASHIPGIITEIVGVSPVDVVIAHNIATVSLAHGDYVDLTGAQTITGVKTFTDPNGILFGTDTGSEGSVSGNATAQSMGFGAKFVTTPFVWEAEATEAVIVAISTANDAENPTGLALYFNAGLTPGNTYNPSLVFSVDSTGHISTGSVPASVLAGEFEGTFGITTSYDAGADKVDISGAGLLASIVSPNHSLLVTISGQTADVEVNPNAATPGKCFQAQTYSLSTTGTLSLSAPLPGGPSQDYAVLVTGTTSFTAQNDSGSLTATNWTANVSPKAYGNGSGATTPVSMTGSAIGGQTPEVSWSQDPFGAEGIDLAILCFPV